MAKNFKGGMDSLLGETNGKGSPKRGRPKTNFKVVTKTSAAGTKPGEIRATFIINEAQLESVKALAYWERLSIKDVLAQAIEAHLASKKRELPKAVESYKSKAKAS
jgi:hypothetical protein